MRISQDVLRLSEEIEKLAISLSMVLPCVAIHIKTEECSQREMNPVADTGALAVNQLGRISIFGRAPQRHLSPVYAEGVRSGHLEGVDLHQGRVTGSLPCFSTHKIVFL